jgi:hypothetical protein
MRRVMRERKRDECNVCTRACFEHDRVVLNIPRRLRFKVWSSCL